VCAWGGEKGKRAETTVIVMPRQRVRERLIFLLCFNQCF
jgi:hypothetical protein